MPVFEYVLLALLGSGSTGAGPTTTILSADAIVQPNGGALSSLAIGQEPPRKDDSRRGRELRRRRHRRHKHRHYSGKKK